MKLVAAVLVSLVLFASSAFAVDKWIPIAGTVGNFRTDARILNPSGEKDIEISAYFLPVNVTNNNERIAGTPVKFTVAKRSQKVMDDVVASIFNATGLGAILFTCPDDFIATSRIYAQVGASTLGQFSAALPPGQAFPKGVVIQLKSGGAFRTNVGALNIANATNIVTWNLYDKTNAKVATVTKTMAAYEVTGPSNVAGFFSIPGTADVSDAWVSFSATNPLFAYGSVIDNASTDPTFVAMAQDTGSDPVVVQPTVKSVDVTLENFNISLNLGILSGLKVGDKVKLSIRSTSGTHGFLLVDPQGSLMINDSFYTAGDAPQDQTFTVTKTGTYTYFCTNTSCGDGHTNMTGTFVIK
jgi:hypothetical protein